MEEDWDLQAVVRGCKGEGVASSSSAARDDFSCSLIQSLHQEHEEDLLLYFPDLSASKTVLQELQELCEPFLRRRQQISQPPPPPKEEFQLPPRVPTQISRSKRRKNQVKKAVCHVPADGLSTDMWAWRKYGQKPIKGSPFPRGYYRCSSSKGCPARKQVERSRTDPGMLMITYTAEHNHPVPAHRNSLSGSTRNKSVPVIPKASAQASPPTEEKKEEDMEMEMELELEEEGEEGLLTVDGFDLLADDEMAFLDFDESPERFSTVFSSNSWAANNAAAAAGGV